MFGLAEAAAHLERALALWPAVPDAQALAGLDLAGLCEWAAEPPSQAGAAPRAEELARRAIALVASRAEASVPLRDAYAVAARLGARPLPSPTAWPRTR